MTKLIIEELKHLILHRLGMRNINTSDCQWIAAEIIRKTRKNISETTIKRVFGFAAANHEFSKFTINTLLAFVEDEENPIIFNKVNDQEELKTTDIPNYLAIKGKAISSHTIQKIIETCSIPYEYTLARKFAEHDFDYFYQSKYSFTAFIAQSGYGKSMLLSHLVKNNFLRNYAKYEKDIVLFLQLERIFHEDNGNQNLEDTIFEMLGINTEQTFVDYFNKLYQTSGRKLILIFDSFDKVCQKKGAKPKIFNSIIQLLVNIEDRESIKIIISMRIYIWRRFFETIRHSIYLKSKWFTGSYYRAIEQANVPVFTLAEIDQLLSKININKGQISETTKNELKYPWNYSLFYQVKDEYTFDYKSNLILHEITLHYLQLKVYDTGNSLEKLILCSLFIQKSDFGRNGEMANKNLLMPEFTKFRSAYIELLLDGVLTEEKYNTNEFNVEFVRFVHQNVFEYFLFKELLAQHQHQIDNNLFQSISNNYLPSKNYKPLLNWSVYQMINSDQFENIKYIFALNLQPKQFTPLLLFLAECIQHKIRNEQEAISAYKTSSFHQEFLGKLFYLDFLDPSFKIILNLFSEIAPDEDTYLIYQCILNLHDCLTINLKPIQERVTKLADSKFQYKEFLINSSELVTFLILKFSGENVSAHPLIKKLEVLSYQAPETKLKKDSKEYIHQQISSINVAIINWILGNSSTMLYPILSSRHLSPIARSITQTDDHYLLSILRLENLKNKTNKKQKQLAHILANHLSDLPYSTSFGDAMAHLIRIQEKINSNDEHLALKIANEAILELKEKDYKILEIMVYQMIIKIYTTLNDIDKINEYRYVIINML